MDPLTRVRKSSREEWPARDVGSLHWCDLCVSVMKRLQRAVSRDSQPTRHNTEPGSPEPESRTRRRTVYPCPGGREGKETETGGRRRSGLFALLLTSMLGAKCPSKLLLGLGVSLGIPLLHLAASQVSLVSRASDVSRVSDRSAASSESRVSVVHAPPRSVCAPANTNLGGRTNVTWISK